MMIESNKFKPTIKDMFNIPMVGGGKISPDGNKVIYRLGFLNNFEENQFEVYAYLFDGLTGKTHQLSRGGMIPETHWIDNETAAILKSAGNSGMQIFVFYGLIGEGLQITDYKGGITNFNLFGKGFVYTAEKESAIKDAREKKFGVFINEEEEDSFSGLFYINYGQKSCNVGQNLSSADVKTNHSIVDLSEEFKNPLKIESFITSSDHQSLFVNCLSKEDGFFSDDTFHYMIEFDPYNLVSEDRTEISNFKIKELFLPKGARILAVSPNGTKLLISHKDKGLSSKYQTDLWCIDLTQAKRSQKEDELLKHLTCLTQKLNQEPQSVFWSKDGIFVHYWRDSNREIARIKESGGVEVWDIQNLSPEYCHIDENSNLFMRALSPTALAEIYIGLPASKGWKLRKITNFGECYSDWDFGSVESIRWTSRDGTEIEGVLRKPSNFDPNNKYALLFYVHGGPASVSPNILLDNLNRCFYPTVQLLNRDILILEPNYRGSLGRGREFKALNFDNLGVGDMWDLESAIDHLVEEGFIDQTRIGSMGWSQGGYISSFVAMHSNKFKAVSAGAALCDWRVYYGGSDMRHTINLTGDPYTEPDIFEKTAPISAINAATTPILFQHGANDPRVPLISAREMYRALKARGIQTYLMIYPGHGHGVLKPRENYALMVQNYRWFAHHLLGEELDFFMDDTGAALGS